jgi:thiamine biosynthesis protein ThiI
MQNAWILRFGELGLKSRIVRRQFQHALGKNMETLAINSGIPIVQDRIRTMEVISSSAPRETAQNLLCHILGVVAIDPTEVLCDSLDPDIVAAAILARDSKAGQNRTFGVRTRRLGPKGEWGTQEFNREVGAAMWRQDGHLSVDLSFPDMWIRLVIEPDRVWIMDERIPGAGGLPPGVQGDVLARINDEDSMLAAFLIMRRGSRLIPVDGCDETLIEVLRNWDPFLGRQSNEKTPSGAKRKRHPWGVVGLSTEEGETYVKRRETDVKTVPLSTLEPLCAWTEAEKSAMLEHIYSPATNPPSPDIKAWVS